MTRSPINKFKYSCWPIYETLLMSFIENRIYHVSDEKFSSQVGSLLFVYLLSIVI